MGKVGFADVLAVHDFGGHDGCGKEDSGTWHGGERDVIHVVEGTAQQISITRR